MISVAAKKTARNKETWSVSEFRIELPDLLNKAALLGRSFTITKHGKPYAILTPINGGNDDVTTAAKSGGQPTTLAGEADK